MLSRGSNKLFPFLQLPRRIKTHIKTIPLPNQSKTTGHIGRLTKNPLRQIKHRHLKPLLVLKLPDFGNLDQGQSPLIFHWLPQARNTVQFEHIVCAE